MYLQEKPIQLQDPLPLEASREDPGRARATGSRRPARYPRPRERAWSTERARATRQEAARGREDRHTARTSRNISSGVFCILGTAQRERTARTGLDSTLAVKLQGPRRKSGLFFLLPVRCHKPAYVDTLTLANPFHTRATRNQHNVANAWKPLKIAMGEPGQRMNIPVRHRLDPFRPPGTENRNEAALYGCADQAGPRDATST